MSTWPCATPPARSTRRGRGAFADARARAEHLAALAGARLGEVQAVAEGGAAGPIGGGEGGVARDMTKSVAIEPGETTVAASVTVTFALDLRLKRPDHLRHQRGGQSDERQPGARAWRARRRRTRRRSGSPGPSRRNAVARPCHSTPYGESAHCSTRSRG